MKLFYLSIITFVFVGSTLLAASAGLGQFRNENISSNTKVSGYSNVSYPFLPELVNDQSFPLLSAQSVYAIDIDSGVSLYEKDPDLKLLPASTTKIITAIVALEHYKTEEFLTVGRVNVVGQKMNLVYSEQISVENLLYGVLVHSANDAAEVLAQNYEGGREAFIAAMNAKARQLNLTNSNFENPSGLDGYSQLTTARDLVVLSMYAMENEHFADIVATKTVNITDGNGYVVHSLRNINQLLGKVEGVVGVKTGWTENARENLVTYVERDGKRVVIALLGSQDRFGETEELVDWIYSAYEWKEIKPPIIYEIKR